MGLEQVSEKFTLPLNGWKLLQRMFAIQAPVFHGGDFPAPIDFAGHQRDNLPTIKNVHTGSFVMFVFSQSTDVNYQGFVKGLQGADPMAENHDSKIWDIQANTNGQEQSVT